LCEDYEQFVKRQAEVIVVGPEDQPAFEERWNKELYPFVGVPDPEHLISDLYGQEVKLLRMGRLPALMVIDQQGMIRSTHHGHSMRDIPPNSEVLGILDQLNDSTLTQPSLPEDMAS
jgi:peroxiredoxin Q/BCP